MSSTSEIGIDFHIFNAKLTAELHTFSSPGAFATVDLIVPGGHKIKIFCHNTEYARALAFSINSAAVAAGATKTTHTEHQL